MNPEGNERPKPKPRFLKPRLRRILFVAAVAVFVGCVVAARNGHPGVVAVSFPAVLVLVALSRAKLVCPSCGKVVTILGETQFANCPHCGTPYEGKSN
jgi:tRNA(Ile2) C34 agmatinyltransferase TiaS